MALACYEVGDPSFVFPKSNPFKKWTTTYSYTAYGQHVYTPPQNQLHSQGGGGGGGGHPYNPSVSQSQDQRHNQSQTRPMNPSHNYAPAAYHGQG